MALRGLLLCSAFLSTRFRCAHVVLAGIPSSRICVSMITSVYFTKFCPTARVSRVQVRVSLPRLSCLGQVEQLQSQLLQVHEQKDEAFTKDLLLYIKSMPESQLQVSLLSVCLGPAERSTF